MLSDPETSILKQRCGHQAALEFGPSQEAAVSQRPNAQGGSGDLEAARGASEVLEMEATDADTLATAGSDAVAEEEPQLNEHGANNVRFCKVCS